MGLRLLYAALGAGMTCSDHSGRYRNRIDKLVGMHLVLRATAKYCPIFTLSHIQALMGLTGPGMTTRQLRMNSVKLPSVM